MASARSWAADEVDAELIGSARIVYLEGYLFDRPEAKAAFRTAAALPPRPDGRSRSAFPMLSASTGIAAEFLDLIRTTVDILFANEAEITSLYQTARRSTRRRSARQADTKLAALTRSEKGSVILSAGNAPIAIPAAPVGQVVDTTGAGDLYAAGLLYGISTGLGLDDRGSARQPGGGRIIAQIGARPAVGLAQRAGAEGLLP